MEDVPVAALSNAPANHSATSQQPPFSDGADGEEAEQSDLTLNLGRPIAPSICDDDNEDDQRGAFDYYTTPAVAAVEALGKPKVVSALQQQNNVAVDYDTASSNDSPRLDDVPSLDDAKRRFEEYEMGAIDHGVYETHRASGRYKTIEDIHNAKTRASNDQQYDERFSVSSTDSMVHSDDESDDNLVNVNVHERLINRDTCYVPMGTDCGDDAMECINQAKTMTIQQPLNSYSSQNYGSTGVHSHAVDTAVSFGIQNRAADNATGFSRELSGASPVNRVRIEKSTYSKRPSPPFGDPVCQKRLTQSALQLVQNSVSHSSLEEPHSHKTDDATAAECSAAKKKKKKKKHSKGDEGEDARSQRDINGNPVGTTMTTTKKQHSSGKIIDSGSSEPHSRADSGYEFSDMSQSQMSSSSDSRFLEKKAKKAKRGRKDACTTQAKDIPGNRGDDDVEALLNYIENGRKKQRPNGQVNGVPPLGGATEQKSFPAKKPGCGKSERKVTETDGKGQSIGSEGKASDVCTGSEESSVSDIVTNMSSMLNTRTMKDAPLVLPICSDTYIFTDFDCILPPKEAEFTEVKKKKKRAKDAANVVQRDAALHAFCQVEPHRKPHISAHSVTPPPPTSSVGSDDAHVERALSPSSFPVLGRSREGRRNSTGNAPPVDGMQDDSDMESVKSVPIGSELSGRLDCGLSPSNFAKQSYAKIAAAQRPGKEGGALYRAEQMHLTGVDGHTAGVKYAKEANRDKAVITSVERVETLGLQNTKQAAVAQSQYSCVQLAMSLPVLSSIDTSPLSDGVRTLVTPDVTITKKIACSTLTQMDAESTNQPLVCSQSSKHGVQLSGDPNSPKVSGLESCPRTRSEPSVCGDLRGGNIEPKPCPIRSGEDQPHTGIPEFIATDVTHQSVCPENAPSHAAAAVPPSDKQDVVAKETQCSNKSLPHPPSSSGAAGGDVSVSIVNTNVESSKMLSPQNNSGLTPATHACALSSTGGCSRAAATTSKTSYTMKRSKTTNKSVIFFDKKLNELPQNLGISFGFGPETISVNDITKSSDAHHGGSCNDACATCERESPMTDPVQQQQPPRDSSLSLVADTMPSLQTPGDDAADVYRTKVLVPVNGIILTHTASPHQGATPELPASSTSYACPERVHLANDSPTPLHTAKPDGRHGASPLYIRANDFNFQRGKFDVEGAVKFLYKEWEKVTRPKRTSRVTFYSDNQHN